MPRKQDMAQSLLADNVSKGSPLDLLGLPDKGPSVDLLQEALDKKVDSPGHKTFDPKGSFDKTSADLKKSFFGEPLPMEVTSLQEEKKEEPKAEEPEEVPASETEEPKEEIVADSKEAELPDYYHALNHANQLQAQRLEEIANQQQQERSQFYETINQLRQQAPAKEEEIDYEKYGFDTKEQYVYWRHMLSDQIRKEIQAGQAPIYLRMAEDRFTTAIAQLKAEFPHFDEYFPQAHIADYFTKVAKAYAPQYLATVAWKQELENAYRVKDYARLQAEYEQYKKDSELKAKPKAEEKKQEKEKQKSDLKLVPKASSQSVAPSKSSFQDVLDGMHTNKKMDFETLAQGMKKHMGYAS